MRESLVRRSMVTELRLYSFTFPFQSLFNAYMKRQSHELDEEMEEGLTDWKISVLVGGNSHISVGANRLKVWFYLILNHCLSLYLFLTLFHSFYLYFGKYFDENW